MTAASKVRDEFASEGETKEFVTLNIGDQVFGVEVTEIHDVFTIKDMTTVPMSAPEIAGVLNLRGRIVTAVDARARLGLPLREDYQDAMAVGVELGGESYGLLIDGVGEVLRLSSEGYEANPCNLDARWLDVARGVYRLDDRLLIILDVQEMLNIKAVV